MAARNASTNAITVRPTNIAISDNADLNQSLTNFSDVLIAHATSMVDSEIGEGYSAIERRSLIMVEALHLTSGMDLAAILTRGALIAQIERDGLASVHPEGFTDVQDMAARQGISSGEYSDIRGLCGIIFPYIENDLGMSVAAIWSGIGKSIFREMRPALQSMITGIEPDHQSVRTSVTNLLNGAAISLVDEAVIPADTEGLSDDQTQLRAFAIRDRAVRDLLTLGATAPARTVRATLRPSRTAAITGVVMAPFDNNTIQGEGFILMKINGQDQLDMFRRIMGDHIVTTTLNSAQEDTGRRGPNHYIAEFRRLFGAGE